jgi:hypothetical protein
MYDNLIIWNSKQTKLETFKINIYISGIIMTINHLKEVVDAIIRGIIFHFSFKEV